MQGELYDRAVADLRSAVASGQIQAGSPDYASARDYIANIKGGVATKEAELATLASTGLGGRRPRLRLV